MIEISEELVEKIATIFCRNCRCFDVHSAIGGEEKCTTGFPLLCQFAQDDAKKTITCILSAVRDDKQKLPGEEWRAAFDGYLCLPNEFSASGIIDGVIDSDWKESDYDHILIALCKEEGEEKSGTNQ